VLKIGSTVVKLNCFIFIVQTLLTSGLISASAVYISKTLFQFFYGGSISIKKLAQALNRIFLTQCNEI